MCIACLIASPFVYSSSRETIVALHEAGGDSKNDEVTGD